MGVSEFLKDASGTVLTEVGYGFDPALGRLDSVSSGSDEFNYKYMNGAAINLGYFLGEVEGQKLNVTKTIDPARLLVEVVSNAWGQKVVNSFDYDVDAAGRRYSRTDFTDYDDVVSPIIVENTFSYDGKGQLSGAVMGEKTFGYQYDELGNMLSFTEEVDSNLTTGLNEPNSLNLYSSSTPLGQNSTLPMCHDIDGNMTANAVSGWSYVWDAENRMSEVVKGSTVIRFFYDPFGRRIKRTKSTVATDLSESLVSSTKFFYMGWKLITEEKTNYSDSSQSDSASYTWGPGIGGVGALLFVNRNGSLFYPVYDANGNVTAYLDSAGNVEEYYNYDPFGMETTIGNTFSFRFSTKYYDVDLGLLLYEFREYDPVLRRWMSRDPLNEPGGVNLSAYCYNNPVNLVDYLGLLGGDPDYPPCTYHLATPPPKVIPVSDNREYFDERHGEEDDHSRLHYYFYEGLDNWLARGLRYPDGGWDNNWYKAHGFPEYLGCWEPATTMGLFLSSRPDLEHRWEFEEQKSLFGIHHWGKLTCLDGPYEDWSIIFDSWKSEPVFELVPPSSDPDPDLLRNKIRCFPGDVLVRAVNGFKAIKDVKEGDEIWSCNFVDGEEMVVPVKSVNVHNGCFLSVIIVFENEEIVATFGHKFVDVYGNFIVAQDVRKGTVLRKVGSTLGVEVEAVRAVFCKGSVYNVVPQGCDMYAVSDLGVVVGSE